MIKATKFEKRALNKYISDKSIFELGLTVVLKRNTIFKKELIVVLIVHKQKIFFHSLFICERFGLQTGREKEVEGLS